MRLGSTFDRSSAALAAITPSSVAEVSRSCPPYVPKAVRAPSMMTMSFTDSSRGRIRGPLNCPTEQNRPVTSFSELFASVQARRESGDLTGALALFEGCERDFPLQKGLVFLVRAELLAEVRQPDRAIATLDAVLASGCRYKRSWLEENPRPPPSPRSLPV